MLALSIIERPHRVGGFVADREADAVGHLPWVISTYQADQFLTFEMANDQ